VQCVATLLKRTEESLYEASTSAFPDIFAVLAPFFNHQECKVRCTTTKHSSHLFPGVNQSWNRQSTIAFKRRSKISSGNAVISHRQLQSIALLRRKRFQERFWCVKKKIMAITTHSQCSLPFYVAFTQR
jgi:hypothetical protein